MEKKRLIVDWPPLLISFIPSTNQKTFIFLLYFSNFTHQLTVIILFYSFNKGQTSLSFAEFNKKEIYFFCLNEGMGSEVCLCWLLH